MATSFPISLPSTGLRSVRLRQMSVVAVGQSPTTLEQQVQRRQGQVWMLDAQYAPLVERATAEALIAALCSLNGREGTFLFGDVTYTTPRGAATGTPLVKGAGQTGEDLETDGWSTNVTGIMKAGDWFQLGSGSAARLYKVLADSDSDGSGNATLTVWPRIFTAWADNAALTTSSPKGVFRLTTDGQEWSVDLARVYGLSFSAVSLP